MQGIEIPIGAPLGQLDKDLKGANSKLNQFAADASKSAGVLGGAVVKGSNQAAFALTNLGRVAQDAPFGFIGIQNNLNPLLESFQRLRSENTSLGATFKALGSSLIGPAGLGIALSIVTAAITFYTQYQQKAKSATKEATQSFKEQKDEFLKSPYEKAVTGLAELTTKISLAKQGFLDKKAVLKEYNDSIGKTIGKVNDLNSAEQALIDNGDKYLQLMLLKAKAEFAFKKAAEASYDIVKKQNEIQVNKNPLELDKKGLAALDKLGKKPVTALILQTQFDEETELKKLNTFANRAVNIAKTAEQEVIDFAKKSGFNLNGLFDIDTDKLKGDVKTVEDILKALDIDYKQIAADQQLIGSDVFTEKIKATKKALNDLIGIGVSTDSGIIKKLQSDLATLNQAAFTFNLKPQADKFSEQLRLTLIQFKVDAALIADEAKLKLDFIDPNQIDAAVKFAENAAKRIVDAFAPIKGPQQQSLIQFQFPSIEEKSALVIKELLNFNSQASEIINNGLVQTFAGIGNAIGDSLANGTNLAQNLGASLLNSLSSVLSQLGQLAIATAVGIEGIKISLRTLNPGPALLAGIALLALAGGVRALGNKVGGSGEAGNKGGGNFSAPIPQASSTISTSAAGSAQDFGGGRVVFEISGTNLIGVLNRAGAKLQRFGP